MHDDQHVNEGDIIVRLDGTETKARVVIVGSDNAIFSSRRAASEESDPVARVAFGLQFMLCTVPSPAKSLVSNVGA